MIIKKKISYKRKLTFLVAAIVILGYLSFNLAVKETVQLIYQCDSLENKINELKNAPEQIAILQQRINTIESDASVSSDTNSGFQKYIFRILDNYCKINPVMLVEVSEVALYQTGEYCVETHQLRVTGSFIPILKLIYEYENKCKPGRLTAIHFERIKDNKTGVLHLFCTLFLQKIKKNKYETG